MENAEAIKDIVDRGYRQGYKDALRDFAWWKDGTQYVGCGIKTLKEEIEEIEEKGIFHKK